MRPNARQFRRHAREAGQPRVIHARQKAAEQNRRPRAFDYRIDGLHNAPDADKNGLRWISLEVFSHRSSPQNPFVLEAARRLEAKYMAMGAIPLDVFNKFARPEFLTPYSPIIALSLSPMPQSWNVPKAEPLRPDDLAQLLRIILEAFPPKPAPAARFNFG